MGKPKLAMKKIENKDARHVAFSKRRQGLIKKAYEISTLCDVDVALIVFSSSGTLYTFSGRNRVEDVLTRFVDLPVKEQGPSIAIHNKQDLLATLANLKNEELQANNITNSEELITEEVSKCQDRLETMRRYLSFFNKDQPINSHLLDERRNCINEMIWRVRERKDFLLQEERRSAAFVNPITQPSEMLQSQPQQQSMLTNTYAADLLNMQQYLMEGPEQSEWSNNIDGVDPIQQYLMEEPEQSEWSNNIDGVDPIQQYFSEKELTEFGMVKF
ncbi:MADS-box transcription factor-like protein [Rhynchospora pubera]|uniref:MADS-box transcription factor-like protein n=1 Tax=Rhynchospora pubera TaxID=906938 RepID=A0AAV8D5L4_9POAL|nr:MADS-box transcription factor-like protein [Rhynchospora pubera]